MATVTTKIEAPVDDVSEQIGEGEKKDSYIYRIRGLSSATKGYTPVAPDLWCIHGEYYDVTPFIDRHPGGKENILLGRGRDCTELFESVHCLSKKPLKQMLAKYKVATPEGAPPPPQDNFSWHEDGFYKVLCKRVQKYFDENTGGNHKSTYVCCCKTSIMFALWVYGMYYWMTTGNPLVTLLTGIVNTMVGFCVMHEASHSALSYKPWINQACSFFWCNWNMWSHFLWMRHHVYGHHSYTGVFLKDPDLTNAHFVIRKHPSRYKSHYKHQTWAAWIVYLILPNQHGAQALLYLRAWLVRHVFGVPIENMTATEKYLSLAIWVPSLIVQYVLPFYLLDVKTALLCMSIYWTSLGVGYFGNVFPNHDTLDTCENVLNDPTKPRDWGHQQVISSGNHTTEGLKGRMTATFWGGMNFQIEHHLFPSVSHVHYFDIAPIVQQTCKEFSIPYVTHSYFHALCKFASLLKVFSTPGPRDPKPIKTE